MAITECSPELTAHDTDFTVYAVDFSEPDTPLVGQGMLSGVLQSMMPGPASQQMPKMVTGRVTKNMLAVFNNSNRETLEVRLRLTESAKRQAQPSMDMQQQQSQQSRPMEQAMTPTGSAEWSSFMQSNPQIGQPSQISRVASPALSQGMPTTAARRDSFGPGPQHHIPLPDLQKIAPTPVDPANAPPKAQPSSRPSSRQSNRAPRKKPPTGRPRGRPRKKPVEGNTSGYEDGTEGEEGPAKKRAKTMVADKTLNNAFGTGPDSLRVAASTSGSLRNFRPIASSTEPTAGSHLQEVPRAPTPVPDGMGMPARGPKNSLLRRGSTMMSHETNLGPSNGSNAFSPNSQDDRSPESIAAATPAYSMDSPMDMGSSPPGPLNTQFMRSTPVSSPVLPPMPNMFSQDSMTDVGMLPEAVFQVPEPLQAKDQSFQFDLNGQDMAQMARYNTPMPTSTPAGPGDALPRLEPGPVRPQPVRPQQRQSTQEQKSKATVPTPPPTTDAIEKIISPPADEPQVDDDASPEPPQNVNEPTLPQPQTKDTTQAKKAAPKPKRQRKLARSHSAGPLALPVPASEPVGPSNLGQSLSFPSPPKPDAPAALRRANSTGPLNLPIPASDPVGPSGLSGMMPPSDAGFLGSDVLPPSSPPMGKQNKNFIKKHAIKQRLQEAIAKGEMPPYCSNCGAIETPTWRKIWAQNREGTPEYAEYSGEPGRITAIEIVKRDEDAKPVSYRLIKKALGSEDKKDDWQEILVCNPCGIWLGKYHEHRPRERWDKDASRVGQERKRRAPGANGGKKKSRSKSDAQAEPTPDPAPTTDAPVPVDDDVAQQIAALADQGRAGSQEDDRRSNPGSTHSRSNGTSQEPIDIEADAVMGTTKRLLFPSPRKDNSPKVLGELAINLVHTAEDKPVKSTLEKENLSTKDGSSNGEIDVDELEALFQSPARPSTPPPRAKQTDRSSAFKTPTRPTPSQRPVTRSVSRSMRSQRSIMSPNQQAPGTPSRTPRGALFPPGSALPRRSPRNHDPNFDQLGETPVTRTINQMLMSDPSGFLGPDSEMELAHLTGMGHAQSDMLDFGNFLSTDNMMPSSSPNKASFGVVDYDHSHAFDWEQWDAGMAEAESRGH
ncbi:hypothetical protein CC79DRAFT_1333554 [Sarocladium strictum]